MIRSRPAAHTPSDAEDGQHTNSSAQAKRKGTCKWHTDHGGKKPGRRQAGAAGSGDPGWRVAALALSACGSSSHTSSGTTTAGPPRPRPPPRRRPRRRRVRVRPGASVVGQPDHDERPRPPDGPDRRLREAVPQHPRDRWSRHPTTPTPTGPPSPPRSPGVGPSRRVHGRRHLAGPVRGPPAGRPAVGLPAAELLEHLCPGPGGRRHLQGQGVRGPVLRGSGLPLLPQGSAHAPPGCLRRPPGSS